MKTAGKHRMQLKQNHLLWKEMTFSLNLVKVETSSSSFILWIIEKIIWCFQCLMKPHLFLLCIQGVLVSTQSNVLIGQTTTRRLFVFFLFVFLSSAGQHFVAAHLLPLNIKAVWIVPAKPAITGERLQLKRGSRKKHVGHQMDSLLYLFPFVNHLK